MSHNVLYMRGQVAELRGNFDEARRWYEEALSISPTHVKSMQRLVSLRPKPGLPFPGLGLNPHVHQNTVSLLNHHMAQSSQFLCYLWRRWYPASTVLLRSY